MGRAEDRVAQEAAVALVGEVLLEELGHLVDPPARAPGGAVGRLRLGLVRIAQLPVAREEDLHLVQVLRVEHLLQQLVEAHRRRHVGGFRLLGVAHLHEALRDIARLEVLVHGGALRDELGGDGRVVEARDGDDADGRLVVVGAVLERLGEERGERLLDRHLELVEFLARLDALAPRGRVLLDERLAVAQGCGDAGRVVEPRHLDGAAPAGQDERRLCQARLAHRVLDRLPLVLRLRVAARHLPAQPDGHVERGQLLARAELHRVQEGRRARLGLGWELAEPVSDREVALRPCDALVSRHFLLGLLESGVDHILDTLEGRAHARLVGRVTHVLLHDVLHLLLSSCNWWQSVNLRPLLNAQLVHLVRARARARARARVRSRARVRARARVIGLARAPRRARTVASRAP